MTEERRKLVEELARIQPDLDRAYEENMVTYKNLESVFNRYQCLQDKLRAYDAAHSEEVEG